MYSNYEEVLLLVVRNYVMGENNCDNILLARMLYTFSVARCMRYKISNIARQICINKKWEKDNITWVARLYQGPYKRDKLVIPQQVWFYRSYENYIKWQKPTPYIPFQITYHIQWRLKHLPKYDAKPAFIARCYHKNMDKEFELKLMKWNDLIFDNNDIYDACYYLELWKFQIQSPIMSNIKHQDVVFRVKGKSQISGWGKWTNI